MEYTAFWFRRDLRLHDNAGLYHALQSGYKVLPVFIFDRNILDKLEDRNDARVSFIDHSLFELQKQLRKLGSDLVVRHGFPAEVWKELIGTYNIRAVYTNRDYEPYACERDREVEQILKEGTAKRKKTLSGIQLKNSQEGSIPLKTYKDHVIFESSEIVKNNGEPYVVFTPYKKQWLSKLQSGCDHADDQPESSFYLKSYPNSRYFENFAPLPQQHVPIPEDLGFISVQSSFPPKEVPRSLIADYDKTRDYPGKNGTSRLGVHFRFGTVSIREKAYNAVQLNQTFLSELIWRDFYSQILDRFPHIAERSFRPVYDQIKWRNRVDEFSRWCEGKTGFPLVDAGMRELNATGYMHNRVRMVTASFLTKHLLIDWRWGEAYFARKLLDFDLASNNGGWQWAAGCGTDAAPYFRIFNPDTQLKKFDPERAYVRQWVPELDTDQYPAPMVNHKKARERCLSAYKEALS